MTGKVDHLARLWLLAWIVLGGWLLWKLSPVVTPFLIALLLAYLGDPMVDRLERLRLPRSMAAATVLIGLLLLIAALFLLIVPMVQAQITALVEQAPAYMERLRSFAAPYIEDMTGLEDRVATSEQIAELIQSHIGSAGGIAAGIIAWIGESGARLASVIINILLVPVLAFYVLRDWDELVATVHALLPRDQEGLVVRLARDSDRMLSGFLRGQLLVMLSLAIVYSAGLLILGLDFAIALGVIAGLFSFVPYLGTAFGLVLSLMVAFVQTQDPLILAGVAAVFGVGQLLEGTVLTPRLVGDRIGVHPVLVIFAAMAGGTLFGFLGVLLALPAAAVVAVLVRHAHDRYVTSEFYLGDSRGGSRGDDGG